MRQALTLFFVLMVQMAGAQSVYWYPHELSIGYGNSPSDQMLDGNRVVGTSSSEYIAYGNTSVTGSRHVNYKYYVSKVVALGVFAGIEKESGTMYAPNLYETDEDGWPLGTFSRTAYTIAFEVNAVYSRVRGFKCYGSGGIGTTIERETDVFQQQFYNNALQHLQYSGPLTGSETVVPNNRNHFNGYISPIGLSFGNQLCGFFEIGFGYKGILNGGVSYNLGKKKLQLPKAPKEAEILLPEESNAHIKNRIAGQQNIDYAYLVIYRTSDPAFFGSGDETLVINDSCKLVIANESKYIVQIPPSYKIDIANPHGQLFHFKAAGGHTYYLRACSGKKYMQVKAVNDEKAKIKSDAITASHHIEL